MSQLANATNFTTDWTPTENTTTQGQAFYGAAWKWAQAVTVTLMVGSAWAFTSLLSHGIQNKKFKRRSPRLEKYNKETMFTLRLVCPLVLFVRLLCTQVLIICDRTSLPHESAAAADYCCEVSTDSSVVFYGISQLSIVSVLWYRQKSLYCQPTMHSLNTRTVRSLSWLVVVLALLGGVPSLVVKVTPVNYESSHHGCVERLEKTPAYTTNYITLALVALSQLILFALFCHPLRVHRNNTKGSTRRSFRQGSRLRVYKAMKKATVSMAVCVLSDVIALLVGTLSLSRGTPLCLSNAVYDCTSFVSVASVLLSFDMRRSFILCGAVEPSPSRRVVHRSEMTSQSSGW